MPIVYEKHKMTPREIFIYIMMAMLQDPAMAALDMTRRTAILEILRKEFCPSVTDDDWASLAREIEQNRPVVIASCMKEMKNNELLSIYENVQERFRKRK